MAKFEGNVEAFRYTPTESDITPNTLVVVNSLVGVTRDKIAKDETGMVFMTGYKSIYSLPVTEGLGAAIARGAKATLDSYGKVKAATAGDTVIGLFWEAVATTDTEAVVLLADVATEIGVATATTTKAGLMSAEDKTKLDGIGTATADKAGLVKPDGTTITIADGVISTATSTPAGGGEGGQTG